MCGGAIQNSWQRYTFLHRSTFSLLVVVGAEIMVIPTATRIGVNLASRWLSHERSIEPFLSLLPIINNPLFPPDMDEPLSLLWWAFYGFTQGQHFLSTQFLPMWAALQEMPKAPQSQFFWYLKHWILSLHRILLSTCSANQVWTYLSTRPGVARPLFLSK